MEQKLNQIAESLDAAYQATERISASGQALDSLAQVRMCVRSAYAAAKALLKEVKPDGGPAQAD